MSFFVFWLNRVNLFMQFLFKSCFLRHLLMDVSLWYNCKILISRLYEVSLLFSETLWYFKISIRVFIWICWSWFVMSGWNQLVVVTPYWGRGTFRFFCISCYLKTCHWNYCIVGPEYSLNTVSLTDFWPDGGN